MAKKEFHYDWVWTLPASPEELWPLVSDTNRFNRDAGLPPVEDVRAPDERLTNARRLLRIRVKGVTLEWEESPFEWLRPHSFGVVRRYMRGPLEEMRVRTTLEAVADGTRLCYQVAAVPRGLFGLISAPIQIGLISRYVFGRTFRRYAEGVRSSSGTRPSSPLPAARARDRLDRIRSRLTDQGLDPEAADRLIHHVLGADDMSLARIRPYALAKAWGLPKSEVLSWCLRAAAAGLLDLQWDVICPRCDGAKDSANTLRDLRAGTVHCDTCLIEFSTDFDQSVEVSFTPSAAVRVVEAPPFCVAGPQITPHVEVQQLLDGGESRSVEVTLTLGRHRARAWGIDGGPSFLVEESGAPDVRLVVGESGWERVGHSVAPQARFEIVNGTDAERLIDVERVVWGDDAATAAEVTAMSEFRMLFSSEVLDAGQFVGVGSLAILFTDLRDSTSLYRRIGDAPAFGRVMEHFEVLERAVAEADGAIVKTIGDAVMAVFRHPEDGMRAVRAARSELRAAEEPLILKAGLHYGHSIAVTMNDRLDYFGSTVNIAARLAGLSAGGDLVVSDAVREDAAVQALFADWGATVTSSTVEVRGIEKPIRTWRVTWEGDGA